jgi:hypothetical protein
LLKYLLGKIKELVFNKLKIIHGLKVVSLDYIGHIDDTFNQKFECLFTGLEI